MRIKNIKKAAPTGVRRCMFPRLLSTLLLFSTLPTSVAFTSAVPLIARSRNQLRFPNPREFATLRMSGGEDKKPEISVYTAATQNGWKPLIFLEEAGIDYKLVFIDFEKREQKSEWYLKINPNGRIPAIVDHSNDDYIVMESNAILMYLADKYKKFIPEDSKMRWEVLQWLFFQTGGVGPMMGQAMYFQRIAAPQGHNDEFAIKRYVDESRRLLEVLNTHLEGKQWMVGDEYSVADMAMYTYPKCSFWAKVSTDGLPNLKAWIERIDARPQTRKAMLLPVPWTVFWGEGDVAKFEAENSARFAQDVKK